MSQSLRHAAAAFVLAGLVLVSTIPASGQTLPDLMSADQPIAAVAQMNAATTGPSVMAPAPPARRAALTALEVAYVSLQAADLVSTLQGLNRGLSEANPLMGSAPHPAAVTALKIGGAASTLFLVNRIARHNRVAAIITMAAVNSVYSVVVARNLRTLSRR